MEPKDLPKDASPLWRWMVKHRVTLPELAAELGVNAVHLGAIRRGERRPGDWLKVLIAAKTLEMELGREVHPTSLVGVPVATWYEGVELERLRKANAS